VSLLSGGRAELDIGCDDPHAGLDVLDGHPAVTTARETADGPRIILAGRDGGAEVNGRLVRTEGSSGSRSCCPWR
jgi:hypothetical protein